MADDKKQKWLSAGIVCAVAGAILTALLPPLILGTIIDTMTTGNVVSFYLIFAYFGFTLLMGALESSREGLLIVFGQKITHALRSSLMDKYTDLTADALTHQEPGSVVSRFVGDVDTVENLFTSGIISMFSDACKIVSILAVIWFRNKGLAIVLLVLLPFLFWFTRIVQKNMLTAQIENRRAVSRAWAMFRRRFTTSERSGVSAKKTIWQSVMIPASARATGRWSRQIFMMQSIHQSF